MSSLRRFRSWLFGMQDAIIAGLILMFPLLVGICASAPRSIPAVGVVFLFFALVGFAILALLVGAEVKDSE